MTKFYLTSTNTDPIKLSWEIIDNPIGYKIFVEYELGQEFYYEENIDFNDEIVLFDGDDFPSIVKDNMVIQLHDYIENCDEEEATFLKLMYL